jgi:hypothetical protein
VCVCVGSVGVVFRCEVGCSVLAGGGGSRCIGSRRGVGASLLLMLLLCYVLRQCGLDLIDDTDGYCNRSIRLILLCNLNCASAYVMNCLFSSHPNFSFRFPLSLSLRQAKRYWMERICTHA